MPKRKYVYATRRYTRARKAPSARRAGGFMRRGRRTSGRVPILWRDRTVAKGLSFPQADTFPSGQVVKLHYNVVGSLTCTGVSGTFLAEVLYRLNSVYDPQHAVGGAQPYYYDALFGGNGGAAPYNKYRVLRSRVDVLFFNDNSATTSNMMVGCSVALNLNATNGTVAASQLMMQRPNTRIVPLPPIVDQSTPGFTFWVDNKQLLGRKDMKDADDQIANYDANPLGDEPRLGLFCFPIDTASVATVEIWYRLHITYYVECMGLNTSSES